VIHPCPNSSKVSPHLLISGQKYLIQPLALSLLFLVMAFLKFRGNQLFTGTNMLDGNAVLVTDETGVVQEIVPVEEAGEGIQSFEGMLCPGFINAHCHLELSHLKGAIAPGSGMVPFLLQVMGNRFSAQEQIQQSIANAEVAMWQNGIVAVGDICNTADTLAAKQRYRMHYHNFVEVSGFVPAGASDRLRAAREVAAQFETVFPIQQVTITPHAPYSVSPQLFQLIEDLPNNQLLSLHNGESIAENQFFQQKQGDFLKLFATIGVNLDFYNAPGTNSLPAICPYLNLNKQWLLVHNCLTTAQDIADSFLIGKQVFFCLCPGANLYIGNPLPDVPLLRQAGLPICLGTDSLASNTQLSILAEMVCLQQYFPDVPLAELLQWATLNGAKALQVAHRYGSFEVGKQPGILLLEHITCNALSERTTVQRLV
jgi:aminodeoxyfutalosine deaminase